MEWLPFDLHPEYPPEGVPLASVQRRYGIASPASDPLRERFAQVGLDYNRPEIVPNTRLALRLTELARELNLHEPFHRRLMTAYWSEAANIGDPRELRRLASEVGLDPSRVEDVLTDPSEFADLVEGSTRHAQSIGIHAIPAFVLDRQFLLLGAQPLESFRRALSAGGDARETR